MATRKRKPTMNNLEQKLEELTHLVTKLATLTLQSKNTTDATPSGDCSENRFNFGEFNSNSFETVEEYFERFKLQLDLFKIQPEKHATLSRIYMGAELNSTLRTIAYPTDINTLTFENIVKLLNDHYIKSKNKYSEAIKFRQIVQHSEEIIANFVSRLKAGARYCQFNDFLDYSLIVQFIHGVNRDNIRNEVIAKKPSKFDDVVTIGLDIEATREAAQIVKPESDNSQNRFVYDSKPRYKKQSGKKINFDNVHNSDSPHSSNIASKLHNTLHDNSYKKKTFNTCYSCGKNHDRQSCRFRYARCHSCKKIGHIYSVCRTKSGQNQVESDSDKSSSNTDIETNTVQFLGINSIFDNEKESNPTPKIKVDVLINSKKVQMELDTGGACSIMNIKYLKEIIPNAKLKHTSRQFRSYTNDKFKCVGYVTVKVTLHNRTKELNLYIVDFPGENIFGREWIKHFADLLNLSEFFSIHSVNDKISDTDKKSLHALLDKYSNLFDDSAGTLKGPPIYIHLKQNATPVFTRARQIPFSLRNAYAKEIDDKIQKGFYKQVTHSEWASPTHVVAKAGKIRITGDYKATLNPQIIVDEHPIPRIDEIFHKGELL